MSYLILASSDSLMVLAKRMALNSFQLFLQQYHPSPPSLKLRILQIVFDVMMTYESDFLGNSTVGVSCIFSDVDASILIFSQGARVVEFLTKLFESADSCEIQTVLCKGLAKLMMSGMVTDENVRPPEQLYLCILSWLLKGFAEPRSSIRFP